jgi:uncharacterized membrane protein
MTFFEVLLSAHILCGSIGLILGTITAIRKKSDRIHKKLGYYFYVAMILASFIAIPMSYIHPNLFLFLISVFTLYQLVTGKRYIKKTKKPGNMSIDWGITIGMGLFATILILYGGYSWIQGKTIGVVAIVFAIISYLGVYQDWVNFTGRSKFANFNLTTHIQRITGGYIASLTAFIVVNNTILPPVLAWLLPSAIMTPVIFFWVEKHKRDKI